MAFNIGRVVAYGCSFTAGQELGDSIILNRPEKEIDAYKRKHGIHCITDIYGDEGTRTKCTILSSQLSWPNYIAEQLGVPCSNRAKLGTSVNEFILNIERDNATGKIEDNDLILVGLTCPTRFSWIDDRGSMLTRFIGDDRFTHSNKLNDALLDTWATDCNLMWEYTKHIMHLERLSNSLGGRLKMVMCVQSLSNIRKGLRGYKNKMPWLDAVKFNNILSPDVSLSTFVDPSNPEKHTHGWGHPMIHIHNQFGKYIYEQLVITGAING